MPGNLEACHSSIKSHPSAEGRPQHNVQSKGQDRMKAMDIYKKSYRNAKEEKKEGGRM